MVTKAERKQDQMKVAFCL